MFDKEETGSRTWKRGEGALGLACVAPPTTALPCSPGVFFLPVRSALVQARLL